MFAGGIADINAIVTEVIQTNFASSIVRWNVLLDGGESKCAGRAEPERLFGPMDDLENLLDVGLKPSYFRFLISFVASSQTGEVPAIDTIEVPTMSIDYSPPPVEPPIDE